MDLNEFTIRAVLAPPQSIDRQASTLDAWVSTQEVDRYGDVLLATGVNLEAYRRNPVMLWAHDYGVPPIGRSLTIEPVEGRGVLSRVQFAPTPFAQEVFGLYAEGFMSAFSVGYRPTQAADKATDQMLPGQQFPTTVGWELWEHSAVPVPGNPGALVLAAKAGSDIAPVLLRLYYPEAKEETEEARIAADLKRLRGSVTSLSNIATNYQKTGRALPWQPDAMQETARAVAALGGTQPEQEPDPAAGDPSDDEAMRSVADEIRALRSDLSGAQERLYDSMARAVTTARQSFIGR